MSPEKQELEVVRPVRIAVEDELARPYSVGEKVVLSGVLKIQLMEQGFVKVPPLVEKKAEPEKKGKK